VHFDNKLSYTWRLLPVDNLYFSSTPRMELLRAFEKSNTFYLAIQQYIPEDYTLYTENIGIDSET
jgi:hypothetical protein